ncbi:hypothetical protein WDU94_008467 [Cyamophila willieti]
MNILMLVMIHLCVRVRNKTNLLALRAQEKYFTGKRATKLDSLAFRLYQRLFFWGISVVFSMFITSFLS